MRPIVISDLQVPTDLKEAIHHAPLEAVTDLWSAFEEDFEASGQRWLCRNDRFYLLVRILNRIDLMHPWLYERCREVEASPDGHLDLWAREHYKDLANDTPMLTANRGWTTHGDLRVGDSVFAPSGQPTQVVAVTETFTDSECYRLTFNDGAQIVAGAGHQWQIRHCDGDGEFVDRTASTYEMLALSQVEIGSRTLAKIEKIDSVPTRCIQVEGGLYVAGRDLVPTRNSTIITYAGAIQRTLVDPEITIGIFSHTKPIAKAFLRQIQKEFESNEALRGLFPEIFYINPAKDSPVWSLDAGITVKRKTNPREATVEAHGLVDGMPTSKHFQLLIYDDVVVPSSVSTPEQIAKTTEAWELSDNLGAVGGQKWMIGTRYHYGDTYEEVMKRGAVAPRIHPATDDGTIDGTPVLFSQELWDEKVKTQGESTVACQLLQNPLAGKQRVFNIEHVGTYEIRPSIINVYIMVDPARSNKKGSANTAMVVLGVDYAMNKYLLDGYDTKMDLMARWQYMLGLYEKWRAAPGVQNIVVSYERYGAIADLQYFEEQMRLTNRRFDIVELEWPREGEGSKMDRIQRLGPDIRGHKLFTPHDTDPKNLTANQRKVKEQGYEFRIASPIRRKDVDGRIYDLSQRLRNQIHFFPFGGRVDVLDAASRIYDCEPRPPRYSEAKYYEPEHV